MPLATPDVDVDLAIITEIDNSLACNAALIIDQVEDCDQPAHWAVRFRERCSHGRPMPGKTLIGLLCDEHVTYVKRGGYTCMACWCPVESWLHVAKDIIPV